MVGVERCVVELGDLHCWRARSPAIARTAERGAMMLVPKSSLRVWPGSPHPLGATWDGVGVNFALFSEHATARRAVPVRFARRGNGIADHPAARADRHGLARLSAGRPPRPALRLPRPRPVRAAARPSLQPEQGRDRSVRESRSARATRWDDEMFGYRIGAPDSTVAGRSRQRGLRAARRGRRRRVHLGRRSRRCARRGTRRSSTRCTSRASRSCTRTSRRRCAAPTRRCASSRRSATSRSSASRRSS